MTRPTARIRITANHFERFVRSTKPRFLLTEKKGLALCFQPDEAEKQAKRIRKALDRIEFADVDVEVMR
jgi:hypothetical protein